MRILIYVQQALKLDWSRVKDEEEKVNCLDEGIALYRHRAGFPSKGENEVFELIADSWPDESE